MTEVVDRPVATARNPYVGPRSLIAGEPIYGRERELDELRDALIADRLVLLYSPSGAGKSSLLDAGLRPALEAKEFLVSPTIRVSQHVEGAANRYVASTMLSLEPLMSPEARVPVSEFDTTTLAEYVAHIGVHGESEICLIFDQFEEVFTLDPVDLDVKAAFFDQLGELLRDRSIWAVIALREDYLAQLDPYLGLFPRRLATRMRLDFLDQRAALAAVRSPARVAGVEFTDDGAELLVDDLRTVNVVRGGKPSPEKGPYVEPVQLQVVCSKLWSQLPEGADTVTRADVEAHADTDNALAGFYADQVAAVAAGTGVSERVIRDWFEHSLITDQSFRAQSFEFPHERGAEVLKALEDAYLIRADSRRGVNWYELTHDRMIAPVIENNAEWRESRLNPLQMRASEWEANSRPAGLLVTGDVLSDAETWAATSPDSTPVERDFVAASRVAENDAKAELARHEQEARKARRRSLLFGALAMLAVAGLIVAAIFYVSANRSRQRAERSESEAAESAATAQTAQRESEARDLAARSLAADDPYEAAFLAMEAESWTDEPQLQPRISWTQAVARVGRLAAVQLGQPLTVFEPVGESDVPDDQPSSMAWNPDATVLAIGSVFGKVRLFDAETRAPIGMPIDVHSTVQKLVWEPNGDSFAVLTVDGALRRYDATTLRAVSGPPTGEGDSTPEATLHADTNPDATTVAVSDGESVELSEPDTGRPIGARITPANGVSALQWSPDGGLLAVEDNDGSVWLFDGHTGAAHGVAFTNADARVSGGDGVLSWKPDGSEIAVATTDGVARLVDLATGRSTGPIISAGSLPSMTWNTAGTMLAVTDENGATTVYDPKTGAPVGEPLTGRDSVATSAAWSPSADVLVVGAADGTVRFFDVQLLGEHPGEVAVPNQRTTAVAWNPRSSTLAVGLDDSVELYDTTRRSPIGRTIASATLASALSWSPDGALLAVGNEAGGLAVFDATGSLKMTLLQPVDGNSDAASAGGEPVLTGDSSISAVAWSPDGRQIAAAGGGLGDSGQALLFFDARTGRPLTDTLELGDTYASQIGWSPDGHLLAVGTSDEDVRLFDAVTHEARATAMSIHEPIPVDVSFPPSAISWSPDSRRIAVGGFFGRLYVFDVATGELIAKPVATGSTVRDRTEDVSWSPAGDVIATTSSDHTLRFFDAAEVAQLGQAVAFGDKTTDPFDLLQPSTVSWSADGAAIAVGTGDSSFLVLRAWSEPDACGYLKTVLTVDRMDELVGIAGGRSACAHGNVVATTPTPLLGRDAPRDHAG